MLEKNVDVAVIGGGPAGLAAAIAAREAGAPNVAIIERDFELGGILVQCIHNGFGLEYFEEDLTGPEYATRFIDQAEDLGVEGLTDTFVLDITPHREIYAMNEEDGLLRVDAGAIVLAMGCRERPRGALAIPGYRPAGVFTAGTAQRLVNVEGYMPGEEFVILGSGDIGMIMARRLTFEGAKVKRMLEILPFISGLKRNLVQCVRDYDIPLELRHTVIDVKGRDRVEAVVSAEVDDDWQPISGTEEVIPCDTLLLSVGLIPENELSKKAGVKLNPITGGPYVDETMQTNVPGIFAAGNVVHVYDLVDWVTEAGILAGRHAGRYAMGLQQESDRKIPLVGEDNVHHIVPQHLDPERLQREEKVKVQFRVRTPIEDRTWVILKADGKQVKKTLQRYVRPSEMIEIPLNSDDYDTLGEAEELSITVERKE